MGGRDVAHSHSLFCLLYKLQWLETIISTALRKKSGEERQLISSKLGLPSPQPLVCFGLCTGASSDPVVTSFQSIKGTLYLFHEQILSLLFRTNLEGKE